MFILVSQLISAFSAKWTQAFLALICWGRWLLQWRSRCQLCKSLRTGNLLIKRTILKGRDSWKQMSFPQLIIPTCAISMDGIHALIGSGGEYNASILVTAEPITATADSESSLLQPPIFLFLSILCQLLAQKSGYHIKRVPVRRTHHLYLWW